MSFAWNSATRMVLVGVALALSGPALAEIATVKRVSGAASIERNKKPVAITAGTKLEVGDLLNTGKDGRISVTFIDDSRFSVGPASRIRLTKFDFDDVTHQGQSATKVEKGSLAVVSGQIAKENPKGMTVQTPTSVLGVRGTRFVVTVQ
ncbi:MAG: FecR family protein [Polymorphobacter sp.]